jgi:hypothetical protein
MASANERAALGCFEVVPLRPGVFALARLVVAPEARRARFFPYNGLPSFPARAREGTLPADARVAGLLRYRASSAGSYSIESAAEGSDTRMV